MQQGLDSIARNAKFHPFAFRGGALFLVQVVVVMILACAQSWSLDEALRSASILPLAPAATNTVSGQLKAEAVQYTSDIPGNSQLSQSQNLIGRIRVDKSEGIAAVFDITAGSNVSVGASHFGVSELYAGFKFNEEKSQLNAGRKLEFWSQIDSDWQLGQWQPTFGQIDALKPLDQGLSGIFLKQSEGHHELLAFVSPLFIPSMGPDVQEDDGRLVSDSRWYREPSPTFKFRGITTRAVYSLDMPSLASLTSNTGAGLRYSLGKDTLGPWASANYGYKPVNSLLLRYKIRMKTPEVGSQGEAVVSPEVGYHTIAGLDLGYRLETSMVSFSYLQDIPVDKTPVPGWFQQRLSRFEGFALHADTHFENLTVAVDYLRLFGGQIHDVDSDQLDQGALFDRRFLFSDAAAIKLQYQSHFFRRPTTSSVKYTREFNQRGDLISAEMDLHLKDKWVVSIGADVLSVDNENNVDGTFLNQFRANDRYHGGLSYVF